MLRAGNWDELLQITNSESTQSEEEEEDDDEEFEEFEFRREQADLRKYVPRCVFEIIDSLLAQNREVGTGTRKDMRGCLMLIDISGFLCSLY